MFPITLSMTINSKAELDALQSAIAVALGAKPEAKPEKEAPKGEAKAPAAASDAQPAATQATQEQTDAPSGDKAYAIDDAKQLTNKVVAAGKRDEMVALLKEFGVPVSAKLTADQIAPFCKKAEALLPA